MTSRNPGEGLPDPNTVIRGRLLPVMENQRAMLGAEVALKALRNLVEDAQEREEHIYRPPEGHMFSVSIGPGAVRTRAIRQHSLFSMQATIAELSAQQFEEGQPLICESLEVIGGRLYGIKLGWSEEDFGDQLVFELDPKADIVEIVPMQ